MKLSTKLISSFTFVILLLLIIGLASQFFYNNIKNRVVDESREAVKELEISGELEAYLYQSFINAQYYLDEPYRATMDENMQDSLISTENVKRQVRISLQGLTFRLRQIERLLNDEEYKQPQSNGALKHGAVTLDELKKRISFYISLVEQSLNYENENIAAGKELLNITIEPYYRNKLLPMVDQFRTQIRSNMDQQVQILNRRLGYYSNILLVATAIGFIISLILAYLLYKSITSPLHKLAGAAEEIGRGNLEKRIDIQSNDEIGQLGASFNRMAANLNRITFSKDYVDDIIESMGDALIVTDQQTTITKVNSAALSMLGYGDKSLIGQPLSIILKDDENDRLTQVSKEAMVDKYETSFRQNKGELIPVSLSKAVIHSSDGAIEGLVYVASDITVRKESEAKIRQSLKEKELMLAEIHHRVKNNLAVISGLLQMQEWKSENEAAKVVLQDSQLRVKSIALVHEKLYQSETLSNIAFQQYVEKLIEEINHTFKREDTNIDFDIDIEPIELSIDKAIPCSLLLNELIVNIHKHAFNGIKNGKVKIHIWSERDEVFVVVKDNGIGLKEAGAKGDNDSLGMTLINTLVNQLRGELKAYNDDGAVFEIIFNIDEE